MILSGSRFRTDLPRRVRELLLATDFDQEIESPHTGVGVCRRCVIFSMLFGCYGEFPP